MIELPFKISLGVMLLIKNKTCTSILRRRKQPQGEGSWFPKGNSNPVNSTLRSRDSPVCLHPLKCPYAVSGGVCPHESDPPLRERKRSERPLLTQAPNRVGSGVRAEQAALVLGGHLQPTEWSIVHGEAEVQRGCVALPGPEGAADWKGELPHFESPRSYVQGLRLL